MRQSVAALVAVLLAGAQTQAGATMFSMRSTVIDGQKADLIEEVKLQGDLRLRHEEFIKRTGGQMSRTRERFRLRYGADAKLPLFMTAGLHLASGTGEQVSTNQSMDNLSSQKEIWIDRVYLKWAPVVSEDGKVHVTAGRMSNPFWRTYSSDVVWDDDFNPEGLAQGVEWYLPSLGGIYFANAMEMVVDEDSGSRADQWLVAGQVGAEYRLPLDSRLRLAGAFYEWSNARVTDFSPVAVNEGNRRSGNRLLNDYKVAELTGQFSSWLGRVPMRLQGTFARNTAARYEEVAGRGMQARNQTAYQLGSIFGEASNPGTWEGAYFYKWSESDAVVADVADSDFGDGGTNRRGHILWVAYNPLDWVQLKAKYFHTAVIANGLPPGAVTATANPANKGDDINRLQLDFSVKF